MTEQGTRGSTLPTRRTVPFARGGAAVLAAALTIVLAACNGGETQTERPGTTTLPASTEAPGSTSTSASATTVADPGALGVAVDSELRPALIAAPGLRPGDPPRPLGRVAVGNGPVSDLVLGELIVTAPSRAELTPFLERWGGEVVDSFADDPLGAPGDPIDFLVRLDLGDGYDPAALAADLLATDPTLTGALRASSGEVLSLLAVAAAESARGELPTVLNWVATSVGIADGTSIESGDLGDAFNLSYIRSGSVQDIGVDAAWRLLEGAGKLDATVRVMVVDGGFTNNPDFPDDIELLEGDWGDENNLKCGKGNECPWHGTDVSLAAVAQLDNEYGTAGPAGPVADLVAFEQFVDMWKTMRRVKKAVAERDIDVVNMSFSWDVGLLKSAHLSAAEKHIADMTEAGAIVFAAAGNDGRDVDAEGCSGNSCSELAVTIPCETKSAICVGGLSTSSTFKAPGSNYGNKTGDETVEIYGPFCVRSINDPANAYSDATTRTVCGTSFSSPFVAGIAALVKAADPGLGPDAIWAIMRDTAHVGGVGFDIVLTGHQRRVNARDAVAAALGAAVTPPQITIEKPEDGDSFTVEEFLEFKGAATEFSGIPLPLRWESDRDGPIGDGATFDTVGSTPLSAGIHTITATAVDLIGQAGTAEVTIEIIDQPPEVAIVTPAPGTKQYEGEGVDLVGFSKDPDTFGKLDDGQVMWHIVRKGTDELVWSGSGHSRTAPGEDLPPGEYLIRFTGTDGGGSTTASSDFIVLAVPPGEDAPLLGISSPKDGDAFGSGNGVPVELNFAGSAHDPQDGFLSGTRFRWTATSDRGTEIELCRGSGFPEDPFAEDESGGDIGGGLVAPTTTGPPTLGILRDCSDFVFELGLDPESIGATTWAVTLEAIDSAGLVGSFSISIEIFFVTK